MNMITDKFNNELEKAEQKRAELLAGIDDLKRQIAEKEEQVSEIASEGDFQKAEKILGDVEKLKNEIELKRKFYSNLDMKNNKKIEKAGISLMSEFKKIRNERLKKGEELSEQIQSQLNELFDMVQELQNIEEEDRNEQGSVFRAVTKIGLQHKDGLPFNLSTQLSHLQYSGVGGHVLFVRTHAEKQLEDLRGYYATNRILPTYKVNEMRKL